MQEVYDLLQSKPGLVAYEITFTVAPGRCRDIQKTKREIMMLCRRRCLYAKGIQGFILTRENHANGWPHVHGIVWFLKSADNARTLSEGRVFDRVRDPGTKRFRGTYLFNELGRTSIDPLRATPYEQVDKDTGKRKIWNSWFEYIQKDQHLPWKEPNTSYVGKVTIEWDFEPNAQFLE